MYFWLGLRKELESFRDGLPEGYKMQPDKKYGLLQEIEIESHSKRRYFFKFC